MLARVLRSTSWIILGYGGSQAMRLASNLILTRLLFPEAFGLMTLISVITVGLSLFSDVGIAPSIAQSKRGDDRDFLNTAWTIQVMRGVILCLIATAVAWPAAQFYDAPELIQYLPIAALSLLIAGFNPTRIETAHRHLLMGRLTVLDLTSQAIGIIAMIFLAWAWQSVAALVWGGVISASAYVILTYLGLPGASNRFRWERAAASELIGFGKWIFLSTAFYFFASQGDKAILGKFLSLENLGIYNIGYFLASFPLLLGTNVTSRIMIPIYREILGERQEGPARLHKMRFGLSAGLTGLLLFMAFIGPWLVDLLYDSRYISSGAIVTVLSVALLPQVIGLTYDQAALAAGDSRRFFIFSALRSTMQVGMLLVGATYGGLAGAVLGMGVAILLSHSVLIWLARAHGVWDIWHDLTFLTLGGVFGAGALWLHWDAITQMVRATAG